MIDHEKENDLVEHPLDDSELEQLTEVAHSLEQLPYKLGSRRDERFIAFHLLYAVDRFDYTVSLEQIAQNLAEGYNLVVPSDSFAMTMAQQVVAQRNQLDEAVTPYLKRWKLERLGVCTRLILRMGVWELRQADAIPSIIINEAVEVAKAFAEKDAFKFINGILDEMCKKEFPEKLKKEPETSES